jgi:hypothetical protein
MPTKLQISTADKAGIRVKSAIDNIRILESEDQITFLQAQQILRQIKYTADLVYNLILYKNGNPNK